MRPASLTAKVFGAAVLTAPAACANQPPPAPTPAVAVARPPERQLSDAQFPVSGRPGPVAADQLRRMITGQTVRIGAGSAHYGADGSYSFDGASPGRYRVRNGTICVDFDSGNARCDQVILEDGRYYLIDRQGRRSQFRPG